MFLMKGVMAVTTKAVNAPGRKVGYWRKLGLDLVKNKWLYIMMIPGLIYFLLFKYLPMWGIIIAFEDYSPFLGPFKSTWKGLYWFQRFFATSKWWDYLQNTLILSFMSIVFTFPAPIILALMLNEIRSVPYKKVTQTLLYMPHFISIVIVVGQSIWKETGWGTIIFLAALTNVDTQLYEAAMIDGANRAQRLWHITLPAIRSTIVLMLVLRMGSVLDTGYEHLILMSNALNRSVSQTLDVFVYQNGIVNGQLSYTTAVGVMKSVVSVILVVSSNKIAHALGEEGLY